MRSPLTSGARLAVSKRAGNSALRRCRKARAALGGRASETPRWDNSRGKALLAQLDDDKPVDALEYVMWGGGGGGGGGGGVGGFNKTSSRHNSERREWV